MQLGEAFSLDVRRQRDVISQREFYVTAAQPRFELRQISLDETDREVRITLACNAQYAWQINRRDRAEHTDLDFAGSGVAAIVRFEGGCGLEQLPRFVELAHAEARKRHPGAGTARKQVFAEQPFEFADRHRDRRLGHIEFLRRGRRAAGLRAAVK